VKTAFATTSGASRSQALMRWLCGYAMVILRAVRSCVMGFTAIAGKCRSICGQCIRKRYTWRFTFGMSLRIWPRRVLTLVRWRTANATVPFSRRFTTMISLPMLLVTFIKCVTRPLWSYDFVMPSLWRCMSLSYAVIGWLTRWSTMPRTLKPLATTVERQQQQ